MWQLFWDGVKGVWYSLPLPINVLVLMYFIPAFWIKWLFGMRG